MIVPAASEVHDRLEVVSLLHHLAQRLHSQFGLSPNFSTVGVAEGLARAACIRCAVHLCMWVARLGGASVALIHAAMLQEVLAVVGRMRLPRQRVVQRLLHDPISSTRADCAVPISAFAAAKALHTPCGSVDTTEESIWRSKPCYSGHRPRCRPPSRTMCGSRTRGCSSATAQRRAIQSGGRRASGFRVNTRRQQSGGSRSR